MSIIDIDIGNDNKIYNWLGRNLLISHCDSGFHQKSESVITLTLYRNISVTCALSYINTRAKEKEF